MRMRRILLLILLFPFLGDRAFRDCIGALLPRLDAHAEQMPDPP